MRYILANLEELALLLNKLSDRLKQEVYVVWETEPSSCNDEYYGEIISETGEKVGHVVYVAVPERDERTYCRERVYVYIYE